MRFPELSSTLVELERLATGAQARAGLVPEWATRPLLPWEVKSRVNFQAIDRIAEDGYAAVADLLGQVRVTMLVDLQQALHGVKGRREIAKATAEWASDPSDDLDEQLDEFTDQLSEILSEIAEKGGGQVVGEATAQGVGGIIPSPLDLEFGAEADATIQATAAAVRQAVLLIGPRPPSVSDVIERGEKASIAQQVDMGRQAVNVAQGAGRAAQTARIGVEPAEVYSSELLDRLTCQPCKQIDGKRYGTIAEALRDYPDGPYLNCRGGSRCRGTLVVIWPDEAEAGQDRLPNTFRYNPNQARDDHGRWASIGGWNPTPYQDAKTSSAAGRALQAQIGDRGKVTGFYDDMNLDTVRVIASTAGRLYHEHPHVRADFRIGEMVGLGGSLGETRVKVNGEKALSITIDEQMTFHPPSFGPQALTDREAEFRRNAGQGWHHITTPVTMAEYTVTHEFGHVLEFSNDKPVDVFSVVRSKPGRMLLTPADVKRSYPGAEATTSEYGASNDREAVAEAFADVTINGRGQAFPVSGEIYDALVGRAKLRYNPHQPRDDHGQWTSGLGGGGFGDLMQGRGNRIKAAGDRTPETRGRGLTDTLRAADATGRERILERGLNFDDPDSGLRCDVVNTEVNVVGDTTWTSHIYRGAQKIGEARNRMIDTGGRIVVQKELLKLDPSVQGKGFGSRWTQHEEDWYASQGVDEIQLHANIDVGGYAWARQGFDWARPWDAVEVMQRVASKATGEIAAKVNRQAQSVMDALDFEEDVSAVLPTPFEVSQIGFTPGATSWPGKDGMLGSSWSGKKVLGS